MTPARLAALQEGVLDSIKRAHPGTTDNAISAAAGVDRTQVSKWRAGVREMGLSELVGMVAAFGAPAVLGPIAGLEHADVVDRQAPAAVDPVGASIEVCGRAALLAGVMRQALSDGRLTREEREQLVSLVRDTITQLQSILASLQ